MNFNRHIFNAAWDIARTAETFFNAPAKEFIGKSLELIYEGMESATLPATTAHEIKLNIATNNSFESKLIELGGG